MTLKIIFVEMYDFCHEFFVQRSEFILGSIIALLLYGCLNIHGIVPKDKR